MARRNSSRAMPGVARFHVPSARPGVRTVSLSADEAHHLRHVLRLDVGAEVIAFDGAGHEWRARVGEAGKSGVQLALEEASTAVAEPAVNVTLGIGWLKGDQMDAVVRDATMLGASAIAPFISEHVSVPATVWRRAGAIERWQRVAVSSAKQCHRAVVPGIEAVRSLSQLIDDSVDRTLVVAVEPSAENDLGGRFTKTVKRPPRSTALALIGPEGGWSSSEITMLKDRGAELVQLGPRTLRAETAPTVLLTVLWTMWGW